MATPQRVRRRSPTPAEFRPDIQGLRAVSVLAVVGFHAGIPWLDGGFVGVDVFFVISGFLITTMLWRELTTTGAIRLARFYGARMRRLLPAAATVTVATALGVVVLLPPLQARDYLRDGLAVALYLGNYRFAQRGVDYLAAETPPSPFQHYWSLGVEEQFYLVWPALILGVALLGRGAAGRGTALRCLLVLTGIGAASFVLSLAWTRTLPPWAFFSLPSRAWELAAGGALALSADAWRRLPPRAATVTGAAGLALVVVAVVGLGPATPYPGTAALLPVLGAAAVIAAGCADPGRGAGGWLSRAPLQTIGRLSYSWYLWHWPVLLLLPAALGHPLNLADRLAAVTVSAGLAALTLALIENPVRHAAVLRAAPARSLALGGALTALGVGTSLLLLAAAPASMGHGAPARALTIAAGPARLQPDGRDAALRQLTSQVQSAVTASADMQAVPSNLSPALGDALDDLPSLFFDGCVRTYRSTDDSPCTTGDLGSSTTVALVGDSHAAMWQPALETLALARHWQLQTFAKSSCPPLDLPITIPYLGGREYTECEQWRAHVVARLAAEHPRLVVVGLMRRYGRDFGFTTYGADWLGSLTRSVSTLRHAGAAVLVLGPIPAPQVTVPTCLSAHLDDVGTCTPAKQAAVHPAAIAAEASATDAGGGRYADVTDLFCDTDRCPVIIGNSLVYRDNNHMTATYARALAPVVQALVDRSLARD